MPDCPSKIEINCDMGEGFGRWKMGPDEDLMAFVDVANVACGFHAGDPSTMLRTVRLAKAMGVKVGAHPGLPDLFGFGRRRMEIDPEDMYASILYQVGALKAVLDAEGMPLNHIKPHGELYLYMRRDKDIMRAILRTCQLFGVPCYASLDPVMVSICEDMGVAIVKEFYPDVDYDDDGLLVSILNSQEPTEDLIRTRVLQCADTDSATSQGGHVVKLHLGKDPFSVCIHSDRTDAVLNAKAARIAVDEANEGRYICLE